ncbi:RagB/SusD family nutrient uptake outer membrane protein [Flavobacterium croceum]|uniref:RagB/SusD family nutrient uptake outer membrane protein n=1 Tax=Flavobacterium croceum TaxID=370975 RepID=UPI0024A7E422|nr:RagB/SusD family nutrient uptake outer membrane protein [Flavobacterium croceum]
MLFIILFSSCTKESLNPYLDNETTTDNAVKTSEDIRLLANGMYKLMRATEYYGRDFIIYGEVRSDNTFSNGNSGRFVTVGQMIMNNQDGYAGGTFSAIYKPIASANIIINSNVTGDADEIKHIKGEALAVRALCHFDLVKLFGQQHVSGQGGMNALGVAYVTKYHGELVNPSRETVAQNKAMIYADLDAAIANLSNSFDDSSKLTITTTAAHAIKSRVATYFGDWSIAKTESEWVINNGGLSAATASNFVSSFGLNNPSGNKIFELASTTTDSNGINGLANIYRGSSYGDIVVLDDLKNTFGTTDVRGSASMIKIISGKLRNSGKYPTGSPYNDNIKVIRYEEIILNYAEALYRLNPSDSNALTQLNIIPSRRNATLYTTVTEDNILLERRKELCFEGFRFYDLARTGRNIPLVSSTQQTHGGVTYGSYKYAFPIPYKEMYSNTNAIQNFGY